jgi:serine/threonine protein kinase/Tol biopolymer transport system component
MATDPARWRRLESVVHAALARPAEERAAFLIEACADDGDLRREAASLLERDGGTDAFLGTPLDALAAGAIGDARDRRPALTAGQTLAHYRIINAIGAGGMGQVYAAEDTRLDRHVAIKILPPELGDDADRRARFTREAKAVAALNHPNIVTVYAVEEADGLHFITMELVRGRTLAELLPRHGFALDKFLEIAIPLTDALAAAHQHGITHRDVKPTNVMVTDDGRVKVLDFGLAKAQLDVWNRDGTLALRSATEDGHIVGTPAYMSPEQAEGKKVDARSDIFSLGIVLYELLTGQWPFAGDSATARLSSILHDTPRPLSELKSGVPRRLARVVQRCLEKNPVDRYQSAIDLRHELQEIQGQDDSLDVAAISSSPSPLDWRRALPIGAALVIGGLVVGSTTAWRTRSPEQRALNRFSHTLPAENVFRNNGRPVFALSPDGRAFVYNTISGLYLREMGALEARLIPGTEAPLMNPFFSPDGQSIAYFDGRLKRISVTGGAPTVICEAAAPFGASWGADNFILFGQPAGIMRVSADGGTPELVIKANEGEVLYGPQLLPGGDWVLFSATRASGETRWDHADIAVQSMATGTRSIVLAGGSDARYLSSGHLTFARANVLLAVEFDVARRSVRGTPVSVLQRLARAGNPSLQTAAANYAVADDGTLVYIHSSSARIGGPRLPGTLVWVDRAGHEEELGTPPCLYDYPHLSPDGTRVAVTCRDGGEDVHVWDVARRTLARFTYDQEVDVASVWTHDGKRLVWASGHDGGRLNLYWQASDGSGTPERLIESQNVQRPLGISPDGEQLLMAEGAFSDAPQDLALLNLRNRAASSLTRTPYSELSGAISPDGKWLAYESDESRQREVWVRPFPAVDQGGRWLVSRAGGTQPLWARNGKELFYIAADGALMAVPISAGNQRGSFTAGIPSRVIPPGEYRARTTNMVGRTYDVSPDGTRFLRIKTTGSATMPDGVRSIVVVQNWVQELERLVPTR